MGERPTRKRDDGEPTGEFCQRPQRQTSRQRDKGPPLKTPNASPGNVPVYISDAFLKDHERRSTFKTQLTRAGQPGHSPRLDIDLRKNDPDPFLESRRSPNKCD
ncbi:unnamed protein product [Lampetra fluviatilis]